MDKEQEKPIAWSSHQNNGNLNFFEAERDDNNTAAGGMRNYLPSSENAFYSISSRDSEKTCKLICNTLLIQF